MKSTIKLFLVVCLFSSVVFADGELPNGNRSCPNGATTCIVGTTTPTDDKKTTEGGTETTGDNTILTTVEEYWDSMVKYLLN